MKNFNAFLVLLLVTLSQSSGRNCDNDENFLTFCLESSFCNATYLNVNFFFNISRNPDNIRNVSIRIRDQSSDSNTKDVLFQKNFSNLSAEGSIVNHHGYGDEDKQIQIYFANSEIFRPHTRAHGKIYFTCTKTIEVSTRTFETSTAVQTPQYSNVQTIPPQSTTTESDFDLTVILIVIFSVILIIILVFALVCFKKLKKKRKTVIENIMQKQNEQASEILPEEDNNGNIQLKYPIQEKQTKIFLIFANDNEKHKQVVLNFANFLQADLGFDVNCELFQSLTISEDPVSWMDHNIKNADKIIVIWSPKAVCLWSSRFSENGCKHDHYDLFTPVLKHIWNDIFNERNIRKYYFGYFDYFRKESIPKEFGDSQIYNFHLMQEFDELYCQLNEIEKYVPGGEMISEKVNFKSYFDKKVNKYGAALQTSIETMVEFVKENPNWQQETDKIESDKIVEELDVNPLLMNVINISPPSPLKSGNKEELKHSNKIETNEQILEHQDQSNLAFDLETGECRSAPDEDQELFSFSKEHPLVIASGIQLSDSNQYLNKKVRENATPGTAKYEKRLLNNLSVTSNKDLDFAGTQLPIQILSKNNFPIFNQEDCTASRKSIYSMGQTNFTQIPKTEMNADLPSSTIAGASQTVNSIAENTFLNSVTTAKQDYIIETEMPLTQFNGDSGYVGDSLEMSFRNENGLINSASGCNSYYESDREEGNLTTNFTNVNPIKSQNIRSDPASVSEKVILAPLEIDSDPMKSLMDLNMINAVV